MNLRRTQHFPSRSWILGAVLALSFSAHLRADDLFLGEEGRFRVSASWQAPRGFSGVGQGVPLSEDSGTFWFFQPDNVELVVKVIDACAPPFERFWFFAAGLTNVAVEIEVEDLFTGETQRYTNAAGQPFQPIQDTAAFATCGVDRSCGQGSAAGIAATPRADAGVEALALVLSGGVTARQDTYDRLVADIAAIKAEHPELADANFHLNYDANTLLLTLTPEAAAAARAGTYHEWDCLNDWYDAVNVQTLNPLNVAFVTFRGQLRTDRLAPEYLALDGVLAAEQNFLTLPPFLPVPPDMICAFTAGGRYHYLFETPTLESLAWYFVTEGPGAEPILVDQYIPFPILNVPPAWLNLFASCKQHSLFGFL
jgi:hypothetical protein